MDTADTTSRVAGPRRLVEALGAKVVNGTAYVGGVFLLQVEIIRWIWRSLVLRRVRFGRRGFYAQVIRVGVRSVGVITLISGAIGLILALQMAPPLAQFGQTETVANIIAIAVVRELGPLVSAIVLTGFAGASIAAELGTMVVGEEIEALEAHALNPVRFLIVPRVLATALSMVVLATFANLVAIFAGWMIGVTLLAIPSGVYIHSTIEQLDVADFLTGLVKALAFGGIIGTIASYNGISVRGGAAGVGLATTRTVVLSILLIILTDLVFTSVFYALGWT
ncbi:MAG: hypothetical protein CMJ18_02290 [Phycisphaeraceae bacterium]|nr:hypothetical protein [Phycisphaeraceae bacterium]